jgi:hypothetical protein
MPPSHNGVSPTDKISSSLPTAAHLKVPSNRALWLISALFD